MNKFSIAGAVVCVAAVLLSSCSTQSIVVKPGYDFSAIKRVAVLNFNDAPYYPNSGMVPSELFTKYMLKTGYNVVERTRIDAIIREHQLFLAGVLDPAQVKEFGRIAGVDAIITGSISMLNPERDFFEAGHQRFVAAQVGLTCRMISVETGEVLWVGSDTYDGMNSQTAFEYLISALVDELMSTLKKKS